MTRIANLVHQKSLSTGTGDMALLPLAGRRSFESAFGTGGNDMFFYFIRHAAREEWEVGTGHLSDAATLVRDTVISSSSGDAPVAFSEGEKDVVNDIAAERQLVLPTAPVAGDLLVYDGNAWVRLPRGEAGTMLAASEEALAWTAPSVSSVAGLPAALDAKADAAHTHAVADIVALGDALAEKSPIGHGHALEDVDGLTVALDDKAPLLHDHAPADIGGLDALLAAKADAAHGHGIEDISSLQTALDAKAAALHGHAVSDVTGLEAALDAKTPSARMIGTGGSLTGGGALSGDLLLQLAGDEVTPGADKFYGTDGAGGKGFHPLPAIPGASGIPFVDAATQLVKGADLQAALESADACLSASGFFPKRAAGMNHLLGTAAAGPFAPVATGTGAAAGTGETGPAPNTDALGVVRLSTGTTSTGAAVRELGHAGTMMHQNGKILRLHSRIRLEDLTASGTQEFCLWGGLTIGTGTTANPGIMPGVCWFYDKNSAEWILRRRTTTLTTDIPTGVTVAADTWYDMELVVTGASADVNVSAELFINGASVASVGNLLGPVCYNVVSVALQKKLGTAARLAYLDYEALLMERG